MTKSTLPHPVADCHRIHFSLLFNIFCHQKYAIKYQHLRRHHAIKDFSFQTFESLKILKIKNFGPPFLGSFWALGALAHFFKTPLWPGTDVSTTFPVSFFTVIYSFFNFSPKSRTDWTYTITTDNAGVCSRNWNNFCISHKILVSAGNCRTELILKIYKAATLYM